MRRISCIIFAIFMMFGICSCGGGGGGSSSSAPAGGIEGYAGAASQGDFARFSFNGTSLTYTLNGTVFGNQTGTVDVFPVEDSNGTVIEPFYYAEVNGGKIYMMFAGNIGIAEVKAGDKSAYVVGLSRVGSLDPAEFANKTYTLFTSVKEEGSSNPQWDIWELRLNGDGTGNGTWQLMDINPSKEKDSGTWKIDGDHIVAKSSNGTPVANIIVKPGDFAAGIIVDFIDGSGFAIGLEQKPLTSERVSGTYHMFTHHLNNPEEDCFAEVVVNGTNATEHDLWCVNSTDLYSGNDTLELNKMCDGTSLNGVICVRNSHGDNVEVFADSQDGYYFAITEDAEEGLIYTIGGIVIK